MAKEIARGQLWLLQFPKPDHRRPVLVLSRGSLLEVLHTATVVHVTSTRRGSPTEVEVGVDEGLKNPSCVNLANIFTVRQSALRRYVGSLPADKMRAVCRALLVACGCE